MHERVVFKRKKDFFNLLQMNNTPLDSKRINPNGSTELNEYRSEWDRDYGLLIRCPSFRRLQGKTQLYPGSEIDFFRSRLTHSIEVSQIATQITNKLNKELDKLKLGESYKINSKIVEIAGLAHDLGHPPFGHLGEEVLDDKMKNHGGFEGNAQTFRILNKLEKKDPDFGGLNLTCRSLASILKYDRKIPFFRMNIKTRPIKGYYYDDGDAVKIIKKYITSGKKYNSFKTIECQVMDFADDIAYSTHDLEDAFKAKFLTPFEILFADEQKYNKVISRMTTKTNLNESRDVIRSIFRNLISPILINDQKTKEDLFFDVLKEGFEKFGNLIRNPERTKFISRMIDRFVNGVEFDNINNQIPALSTIKFKRNELLEIELLKNFVFISQIEAPRLKVVAYKGKQIITTIFTALMKDPNILPNDFSKIIKLKTYSKQRVICDFIAGMTDRYAFEFYNSLVSGEPQTIFKPF